MYKRFLALALILAMSVSLIACGNGGQNNTNSGGGSGSSEDENYHLALMAPITGSEAQYGESMILGCQIAINEINASGGVNGKQVVLDTFDDENDATAAANVSQLIVQDSRYDAVIGSYSSTCGLATGSIFDEAKMPIINPCSAHEDLALTHEYVFQRGMTASYFNPMMAENAVKVLGAKRIAVLALNNDAGILFTQYVTDKVEELSGEYGCELVTSVSYNEGDVSDFTSIITNLKSAQPDIVIVNVQYVDMASILRQSAQLEFDTKWYTVEATINDAFIELAGEYGENVYCHCTYFIDNPSEGCVWFKEQCLEKGDRNPDVFSMACYESAMMILTCAQEGAAGDRTAMYDALSNLGVWEGRTGTMEWTADRQCISECMIVQLIDGTWQLVE